MSKPKQRSHLSTLPVLLSLAIVAAISALPSRAASLDERLARAGDVLAKLLEGDNLPPGRLIDECTCIAVLPRVIKGALGIGGRHGKGVISCRQNSGDWSPPAFLRMSGGSIGLQVGAHSSDIVLFIVSERSARSLMKSKFTLGADATVAAGPRSADVEGTTDIRLDAQIYSYADSTGFFAGVSLSGAKLKISRKDVSRFYREKPLPEDLLFGEAKVDIPTAASAFRDRLP